MKNFKIKNSHSKPEVGNNFLQLWSDGNWKLMWQVYYHALFITNYLAEELNKYVNVKRM